MNQKFVDAQGSEGELFTAAPGLDEASPGMGHATWPFAACALDAVGDACAVALCNAAQVIAEKVANALCESPCAE